jgi:D-tyrosyl-tRNA(Tyr) deacylase
MRAVVQRVSHAQVRVDDDVVGEIDGPGLLVLLGVTHGDDASTASRLADRIWRLRVLDGELSASDLGAPVLVVSQFTLYADTRKGRRPSWSAAAPADRSEPLYRAFCDALEGMGAHVRTGRFGARMSVVSVNEGPMTVMIDTAGNL